MTTYPQITERVAKTKVNRKAEDALIQDYLPFIRSETSGFLKRCALDSDDELSIAIRCFITIFKKMQLTAIAEEPV